MSYIPRALDAAKNPVSAVSTAAAAAAVTTPWPGL
jgi:hypothetical protein